jgi:hypothetical protein
MPHLPIRLLINTFSILGALFALWKGGPAERRAAVIVMINVLVGQCGGWLAPKSEDIIRLVNDGLAAFALLAVTVRYGALWAGGVMLFFAAQFALHSFYLVSERSGKDNLHALINNLDWSGITWCLIIGAAVAWRGRVKQAARSPAT